MANDIVLKRSDVASKEPTTSDLALGEVALNTYDGKAFMKTNKNGTEAVVQIGEFVDDIVCKTFRCTADDSDPAHFESGIDVPQDVNISTVADNLTKEGFIIGGNGLSFFYYDRNGDGTADECVWINNVAGGIRLGTAAAQVNSPKVNLSTSGTGYFEGKLDIGGGILDTNGCEIGANGEITIKINSAGGASGYLECYDGGLDQSTNLKFMIEPDGSLAIGGLGTAAPIYIDASDDCITVKNTTGTADVDHDVCKVYDSNGTLTSRQEASGYIFTAETVDVGNTASAPAVTLFKGGGVQVTDRASSPYLFRGNQTDGTNVFDVSTTGVVKAVSLTDGSTTAAVTNLVDVPAALTAIKAACNDASITTVAGLKTAIAAALSDF